MHEPKPKVHHPTFILLFHAKLFEAHDFTIRAVFQHDCLQKLKPSSNLKIRFLAISELANEAVVAAYMIADWLPSHAFQGSKKAGAFGAATL